MTEDSLFEASLTWDSVEERKREEVEADSLNEGGFFDVWDLSYTLLPQQLIR